MKHRRAMGYYLQFPAAVPRPGAGRVRVTHPCATRQQDRSPLLPFDLHVLGLPLAFILSQDQTLRSKLLAGINPNLRIPPVKNKWTPVHPSAGSCPYLPSSFNELFKSNNFEIKTARLISFSPSAVNVNFSDFQNGRQKYTNNLYLQNIF